MHRLGFKKPRAYWGTRDNLVRVADFSPSGYFITHIKHQHFGEKCIFVNCKKNASILQQKHPQLFTGRLFL